MNKRQQMKVCFFSGDITRSGGTERVGSVIANELVNDQQFDICFLSLWEKQKETFFPLDDHIKRFTLFDVETSGTKILSYIKRIRKFVKENHIDILIDIDGILDMYSIPALRRTNCKLISWEQFNYYQNPYVNYRKFTRKWAARKADAIVVLTDEDKGYYEKEAKVRGILKRIYNPMEHKENRSQCDIHSKTIISAGRLSEQKGFDLLIEVAEKVFEKIDGWQWIICGEGEDRKYLEDKIRVKHLTDKVILKGNVEDIDAYYKKSAMFVLTSRYEGFGLVLTEAKNMGLPCVSFRCPAGPSEIIKDGMNGYLIDCFDIEEMAQKIIHLIQNEELRKQFSEKALAGTEKFDLKNIATQWKDLLLQLEKTHR